MKFMYKKKICIIIILLILSHKNLQSNQNRQYYYPLRTWGYISSGVALISFGFGYYFNQKGKNDYNDSLALYEEYKNATFDFDAKWSAYEEKYNSHESNHDYRNLLYITSSVTSIFGIAAIFIIKKPIDKKISINVYPNQMNLSYKF